MGHIRTKSAVLSVVVGMLAACDDGNTVSRAANNPGGLRVGTDRQTTTEKISAESVVIQELVARRSVLPDNSAYDEVASAVLAANSRTAESELRAATLRAEAASKNWLPRIGADVSLTSLSSLVAALVLEATIFDHGRKKAERAFAKSDVEVAAVSLAEDSNDRVYTALELYLEVQRGREAAALDMATLQDMNHFLFIMTERVKGGVSNISDLNVIRQKVAEIRSSLRENEERAGTALAELNAMAAHPLDSTRGLANVDIVQTSGKALSVVKAEARKGRSIAQARIERANALPGVTAQGRIGNEDGSVISTEGTVGLGTGAELRAIALATETANRDVAQAQEDAARTLRRLENQIAAKDRQAREAAQLTKAAKDNLDIFQQQFDAGQRQVLDVVQVYEVFARQQLRRIDTKYEAAAVRLDMARVLGLLADGEAI